ncbi:hypothetical protein B566_EDAN011359 [Ephemera danica]|nr:hypothetical protein B566_EDAN011359 [Ephemera danica]
MIHEFIASQPKIVTFTMPVEQRVCGRIIGRGGATIRAMQANSGAKISLEGGPDDTAEEVPRTITIRGTENQVKVAKGLIEEKIEEDMENRRIALCSARTPRSPRRQLAITNEGTNGTESNGTPKNAERLSQGTQEGFMEVYVAAMKNPGRFWIQKVGPPSVDLDRLVDKMSEFYNQEENRKIFKPQKFEKDGKWYRALVRDVKPDEYDFSQSVVDLFYVDYGDDEEKSQEEVCMLKSEFLALRTQAIECTIAGVKPASGDGLWSEDASDLFDELTRASCWVPVMAKVKGFKQQERGDRGTSPVPSVELVYNETNIADELLAKGFAAKEEPPTTNGIKSPAKLCPIPAGEEDWNDDSDFEL